MISSSIVVTRPPVKDLVQFVCAQSLDQMKLLGRARPDGCMSEERMERLTQGQRRLFAYTYHPVASSTIICHCTHIYGSVALNIIFPNTF